MKKRKVQAFIVIAAVMMSIAGCGNSGEVESKKKNSNEIDFSKLYSDFIQQELIPQYGVVNIDKNELTYTRTITCSEDVNGIIEDFWFDTPTPKEYQGIISTKLVDLDKNGIQELVVVTVEDNEEEASKNKTISKVASGMGYAPASVKLHVYSVENEEVVELTNDISDIELPVLDHVTSYDTQIFTKEDDEKLNLVITSGGNVGQFSVDPTFRIAVFSMSEGKLSCINNIHLGDKVEDVTGLPIEDKGWYEWANSSNLVSEVKELESILSKQISFSKEVYNEIEYSLSGTAVDWDGNSLKNDNSITYITEIKQDLSNFVDKDITYIDYGDKNIGTTIKEEEEEDVKDSSTIKFTEFSIENVKWGLSPKQVEEIYGIKLKYLEKYDVFDTYVSNPKWKVFLGENLTPEIRFEFENDELKSIYYHIDCEEDKNWIDMCSNKYGNPVSQKGGEEESHYYYDTEYGVIGLGEYSVPGCSVEFFKEKSFENTIDTEEEAKACIIKYLEENQLYIPDVIEFQRMSEFGMVFCGYDDMEDHILPSFWYHVNSEGRIYDEIFCEYVN